MAYDANGYPVVVVPDLESPKGTGSLFCLQAFVNIKVPPNDCWPVIVGNQSYLSEAKELRRRALTSSLIKEAYLSSGV